jgi:LPXTG-site transpeptidase (sortase) family protein
MVIGMVGGLLGVARPAAADTIGSRFVAVTPVRIADTRENFGTTPPLGRARLAANSSLAVPVTGRSEVFVPSNATAVVLNVTVTEPIGRGFITVWPDGEGQPLASNLNIDLPNQTIANLVTARLGPSGAVRIFSLVPTHVVVDVFGYYLPVSAAVAEGRVQAVNPTRVYDSREVGGIMPPRSSRSVDLSLAVPATASAVIANLTVTETSGVGYFSAYNDGTPLWLNGGPGTSNLNVTSAGQTIANQVIVPVSNRSGRAFLNLYSFAGGHVVVDVMGYVTGPSAAPSTSGLFVPLSVPVRFLDTREANTPLGPTMRLWPGWVVEVPTLGRGGVPLSTSMVVGNTTIVDAHEPGYVTAWPAGRPRVATSTVNASYTGQIIPNHTTVPVGTRGVSFFSFRGGHLVFDVTGYYTGTAQTSTEPTPANITPQPNWNGASLTVWRPGGATIFRSPVLSGITDELLKKAPGHWPGTPYPGVSGNVVVFGHRTTCTTMPPTGCGPFRNMDRVVAGDRVRLVVDRRVAEYQVIDPRAGDAFSGYMVVPGNQTDIVLSNGFDEITLVACSDYRGVATGSVSHRIVIRARLVSYTNTV